MLLSTPRLVVWTVLALLSGAALAQETPGSYALLNHDLPATLAPGQRVVGHLTWKVITPGQPLFRSPVVDFYATGPTQRGMRLPGDKFTPWSFDGEHKPGDLLKTTFTLDVPLDFPPGPAAFAMLIARNVEGKGWQYANMQDEAGKALGDAVRVPVVVAAPFMAPSVPLVIPTMPAPRIDGKLTDAGWDQAAAVQFRENLKAEAPQAATTARLGHDATNLYVAFTCAEPMLAKAARNKYAGRDPSVWNNECVEIFLNPQADRVSYMHLLVDLLNQRHDLLGSDSYGFNPAWQSAVSEGPDQWVAEVAIPFSSLGVAAPKPGEAWTGNLCRERKAISELSAWQPTFGAFSAPGRFGLMVFDDLKLYLAARAARLTAPQSPPQALLETATAWQKRREDWQRELDGLQAPALTEAYPRLAAALEGLTNDLQRLKLKAAALSGQGVIISPAAPYTGAIGSITPAEKPVGPVALQALAYEWLDVAWDLTNPTDKPVTLRLTLRDGDPKASGSFLRLGLPGITHQWRLATPVAAGDGRPVIEALVPIPAGTVTVAPGDTAQVWLTLQGQKATEAAGFVRAERLDSMGAEPVMIPLQLRVLPTDLRTPRACHVFMWNALFSPVTDDPAWLAAHFRDLAEHGVDVCMLSSLRHLPRVKAKPDGTLAEPLDFAKCDALLQAARPYFSTYYVTMDIWEKQDVRRDLFGLDFGSPAYEKAFKAWFKQVEDHLLASGLTRDQLLFNPYDESVGDACQKIASWMKAVDPQVKVIIDCSTSEMDVARKMDALTDIWVPHYKYHFAEDMKPFLDLLKTGGKPHWLYYYSEGGTDKAQDPTTHYLAKFWWAYTQGVTGVGYWAQQYYGDPWYRADYKASYDTSLVYPIEGGVVASRRWEAWRRGWQDYQLLALVEAKLDAPGKVELRKKAEEVVTVPGDPAKAEAVREWLRGRLGQ